MLYKVIDVRESSDPVSEAMDRVNTHLTSFEAYQTLYGPDTRSGMVSRVEPFDCSWDWPKIPRCAGTRHTCTFPPMSVMTGDSFKFHYVIGPFGVTAYPPHSVKV